jgi:glycosyltransferase involved in cell wall biosynthesis
MTRNLGILCSSGSWGGLEINILRLAGWMKQRGWKVIIYTTAHSSLGINAGKHGIQINPIKKPARYFDLIGAWILRNKMRQDHIKVLLVSQNRDLSIAAWSKFFSGNQLKIIYQQQMQVGVDKKDFIHTLRFSKIDAWLSPLPYLADEVKSKTTVDPKKIHIVPLCMQTEKFYPAPTSKEAARKILGLPSDKIILGTIGRLDPQKSTHTCIEALEKLKDYPDLHLMIMGERTKGEHEEYETRLHTLCNEAGLEDRVHFRPFHENVQTAFATLDLFIMPSLDETYGMVTIEAMLSGVPVIGADSGGTRELLAYGTMGTLFLPGNAFDLARKIKQALKNFDPLKLMAASAQEHVVEKFSNHRECEMIEDIISDLSLYKK